MVCTESERIDQGVALARERAGPAEVWRYRFRGASGARSDFHLKAPVVLGTVLHHERPGEDVSDDLPSLAKDDLHLREDVPVYFAGDDHDLGTDLGPDHACLADDQRTLAGNLALEVSVDANRASEGELAREFGPLVHEGGEFTHPVHVHACGGAGLFEQSHAYAPFRVQDRPGMSSVSCPLP